VVIQSPFRYSFALRVRAQKVIGRFYSVTSRLSNAAQTAHQALTDAQGA
jgi:hypothetical protein